MRALGIELFAYWNDFATFLGVESFVTEAISVSSQRLRDHFASVVEKWLIGDHGTGKKDRNWKTILEAVDAIGIGSFCTTIESRAKNIFDK